MLLHPACSGFKPMLTAGFLLCSLLLSGCQQTTVVPDDGLVVPGDGLSADVSVTPAAQQPSDLPLSSLTGLDAEAVSELLAAEIAGQRNQAQLALQLYLEQASRLKSPALAQRATYIAQYSGDLQATLDAAALWSETDSGNIESRRIGTTLLLQEEAYSEAFQLQKELLALGETTHFSYIAAQSLRSDEELRLLLQSQINGLLDQYPENPDLFSGFGSVAGCSRSVFRSSASD